jgi:phosphogluconate dehydratase
MSGASGKVPAAIHLVPEAACGGLLAKVRDGDVIRVDGVAGELAYVGDLEQFEARDNAPQPNAGQRGCGRELFALNRERISSAEQGASYLFGEA